MKRIALAIAMLAGVLQLAAGTNIVPDGRRSFEITCKEADKMTHEFIPVFFPAGTEGARISFDVRVDGVKKGSQPWFDARMMTKFIDRKYSSSTASTRTWREAPTSADGAAPRTGSPFLRR